MLASAPNIRYQSGCSVFMFVSESVLFSRDLFSKTDTISRLIDYSITDESFLSNI